MPAEITADRLETDRLLDIVGASRSVYSPEEIAAAEARLRLFAQSGRDDIRTRMRRAGTIAAGIGFFVGIWPLFVAAMILTDDPDVFTPASGDFLDRYAPVIMAGALLVQAILGGLLCAAGIAFRRRQPWGRMVIAGFLWFLVVYCCLSAPVGAMMAFFQDEGIAFGIAMTLAMALIAGLWVMLIRIPLRFFRSDAARYWCGLPVKSGVGAQDGDAGDTGASPAHSPTSS